MGTIRTGISGWRYPPWRGGSFYPEDWPQRRELEYASRHVSTIEINGSFYSLQRPKSYREWFDATPDDFIFALKGGRFITHIKRLRDCQSALANFFDSGVLLLKHKLGPILWQLPPSFHYKPEVLVEFFNLLPRDAKSAAALVRRHSTLTGDRVWSRADANRPLRHAMEVRHASFENREFIELLREHDIALVVSDSAGKWPVMEDLTSDFVYCRLHGDSELYVSGYSPKALAEWKRKASAWKRGTTPAHTRLFAPKTKSQRGGRDVFIYFDNDVKVRAPFDAMSLAHLLGIGAKPDKPPPLKRQNATPRARWPAMSRRGKN